MKYLLPCLLLLFFASCKQETLDPSDLKKVILLQVDYLTNKFEGGKEFSYFNDDSSSTNLPIQVSQPLSPENRLTLVYLTDTIFDGIQNPSGLGKRLFPTQIDPQIHYFRNQYTFVDVPVESRFQVLFYDLGAEPILYDSIWKNITNLRIADEYQSSNITAKIGLFLFRPNPGSATKEDWKWYVVMKN